MLRWIPIKEKEGLELKNKILCAAILSIGIATMTGCVSANSLYDNEQMVADGNVISKSSGIENSCESHYDEIHYDISAESLTGAEKIFGFDVKQDETAIDVYQTIQCDGGQVKLIIVDNTKKTVKVSYNSSGFDTIGLDKGHYEVYVVGKDEAKFTADINMYNYDTVIWDFT